ncbi:hypothetical protein ACVWXO_004991 [Bradyrhizobium sp. LM2.7]
MSATKTTPSRRAMEWNAASPSASAGTAFGETKDPASIRRKPNADKRSISAILRSVGTTIGSICKPSRGQTSWMLISGRALIG